MARRLVTRKMLVVAFERTDSRGGNGVAGSTTPPPSTRRPRPRSVPRSQQYVSFRVASRKFLLLAAWFRSGLARGLSIILKRIEDAHLAPRAAARATKIFERLAEAEAKVHNIEVEKVHFHEVGAVDSIIDIVGSAIGFELLGIDEFACSRLDVGGGQVKTAHGLLPVPAPATAELLRGAPTYSSGIERELVTPTGAAIATALATRYAEIPSMTLRAIGYGAGSADLERES